MIVIDMIKCELCGMEFKTTQGLAGHKWLKHKMVEGKPQAERRQAEVKAGNVELSAGAISMIAKKVAEILAQQGVGQTQTAEPPSELPAAVLPFEDVEIMGEKVNYKVALNPEIFWRYNVFKAEVERRGRRWEGSFSDWLDLVTKDILRVYGIHPTVVSMKGRKLLVEIPVEVE